MTVVPHSDSLSPRQWFDARIRDFLVPAILQITRAVLGSDGREQSCGAGVASFQTTILSPQAQLSIFKTIALKDRRWLGLKITVFF